jgi:hypothetical protein
MLLATLLSWRGSLATLIGSVDDLSEASRPGRWGCGGRTHYLLLVR